MAFDLSRLRNDQLLRLQQLGGDLSGLTDEELLDLRESQEEVGAFGAGLSRAGAALETAAAGVLQELGFEDTAQSTLESAQQTQEEIMRRYQPEVPSIVEEFEQEGFFGGISALPQYIYELGAQSLPQTGAALGAGVAGTLVGGPRVGAGAAVSVGTPFFAGYNIQRQMEENNISLEDANIAKAYGVGVGQAALDAVLGRVIGVYGRTGGPEQIAKAAQRGMPERIARKAGEGAGLEALTESAQQAAEIIQANPEKFYEMDEQVRRELIESAIGGGLLGGLVSAPAGIIKPRDLETDKKNDLDRHMREEAAEAQVMSQQADRFEQDQKLLEKQDFELPPPEPIVVSPEGEAVAPRGMPTATEVDEAERVRLEGIGRAPVDLEEEAEAQLPAVRDVIDVPPGGFRDERERIQERVRDEGVGRAPVFEEPEPALEGEVVGGLPAIREPEPAPELDIPVSTVSRPALPRGTGAIQVPPTARQRANLVDRLEGLRTPVRDVTEPSTERADEAIRERRALEMVDPFNDLESQKLLDQLNEQEQANRTRAASTTRKRLEEKLKALGLRPESISRLLSGTPAEREQLRLFSRKVAEETGQDVRQTSMDAYDSGTVSRFNQSVERIRKQLSRELTKLGLGRSEVALQMENVIRPDKDSIAEGVTQQTGSSRIIIALASQIYSPDLTEEQLKAKLREVMNHEVIHAMRMMGLFTDQEFQTLVNASRNQKFVDKQGNERLFSYFERAQRLYSGDTNEIQQEEAVAELFRDWAAGRKKIAGKPQNLFQRIIKFIKTLGGILNSEGFDDPTKIFEAIRSGEIGRRERGPVGEQMQMYSRKATADSPAFYSATDQQIQDALRAYSYPLGTIGYAVRMPIDQFMRLTYGMGPLGSDDVVRTAKEFLEQMPSNDGSLFVRPERTRGEMSRESFTRFDPEAVDTQNQRGIPMLILGVDEETGSLRVNNHEGRHRTALAAIDGATTIPVIVQYAQPYRKFDSDRLEGNIPRTQKFNYDELTSSRRVIQQFFNVDIDRDERATSYFEGSIPKGVPLDYGFEEQLSEVIGPKSDPLGAAQAAEQEKSASEPFYSRKGPSADTDPFQIGRDMQTTIVPIYPGTDNAPEVKPGSQKLVDAVRFLHNRFVQSTGTEGPVPYIDENVDLVAKRMATEALKALEFDDNAIGWYDSKITEAKKIVGLVEPRIFESSENEMTFEYALAVTSNGTAVTDNFNYALEAFRFYLKNDRMPVKEWKVGGKRNTAMRNSFAFYNTYRKLYNDGQVQMPLEQFLDSDFQVRDLQSVIEEINSDFGLSLSVPSGELADTSVKGSFILGPKIGQGFYQNLRGNYEPLTMDIWWMRMWNRLVGRPFEPPRSAEETRQKRNDLKERIRNPESELVKDLVGEAMEKTGLTRSRLKKNEDYDELARAIDSRWESYFRRYKKERGSNPSKPQFFKDINSYVMGLDDQLQATPANGTERNYMRQVTQRAIDLLGQVGVQINTADFQALLWYPEKRLFKALGVRPGQGQDNDYADAARIQAKKEGISDARIEEALSDPRSGEVADRRGATRVLPGTDQEVGEPRFSRKPRDVARDVASRAGASGRVWVQSREGGEVRGLPVERTFTVDEAYARDYRSAGISVPVISKLVNSEQAAQFFKQAIETARDVNEFGAAVYVYKDEEYADMDLYMTPDGTAGFAIKPGEINDIVSVFNTPGNGLKGVSFPMMRLAYEMGGRKLDAFDTVLPYIYSGNDFRVVSRISWDEDEAPDNWNKELFAEYNNGEPDVVFMAYDPKDTEYREGEGTRFDSYDKAVAAQEKVARRYSRKGAFAPSETYEQIISRVVAEEDTSPISRFLDKVVGRVDGETRGQAFVRNMVNRFLPGFVLDEMAYGVLQNDSNSVGKAMELSQQVSGRMEALIQLGALNIDRDGNITLIDEPDNKGIMEIFAPIGEEKKAAYQTYAVARREKALRAKGRRGFLNISNQDIDKLIAEAPEEFHSVFKDYEVFNTRMVQMAVDSGLVSQEMADNLTDMAYVPFYREMEEDYDTDRGMALSRSAGNSLNNPKVFDKKLEGGTQKLGDFYENIVKNNHMILSASLRNIAMQKTADALDILQAQGVDSWGRKLQKREGSNVLVFRRNGEEQFYKVEDASLWEAIANLTPTQRNAITAFMETFAGILRSGVTLSPGFMLANLWRGKIDAYVKMGVSLNPITTTIRGMRDSYTGGESSTAIKLRTGIGGYTYGIGDKAFADEIRRQYRRKEGGYGPLRRTADGLSEAKAQLEKIGEATEMAERVALFEQLKAGGMSEREAAYQAMNLINFGRRGAGGGVLGSFVSALIPMIPFLNARIQGLYRLIEDPSKPTDIRIKLTKEVAVRGMLVGLASTGLYAIASQDDRWDEERLERKLTYDIFYVGDKTIYLPRAFEIGSLFGAIPMLTLDAIRKGESNDLALGTFSIFWNTLAFNPIPQGALPILETVANFDFFRMAPIEGLSLSRLPSELRAYESTPYAYRLMSQALGGGLSPLQVQQILEGYTGNMGAGFFGFFDVLLGASGAIPSKPNGVFGDPYGPVGALAGVSGVGRFIAEDGERSSRFVSEFYDVKRGIEEVYYAIKESSLRGDQDAIQKLLEDKGTALAYRGYFNNVARQLSELNKQMRIISMSDLNSEQKADRMKGLRETKDRLAKQMVTAAKKAGLY